MPTYNARKRKWVAKRKRGGVPYHLGYFTDKVQAIMVETEFDKAWPPLPNDNSKRNEILRQRKWTY